MPPYLKRGKIRNLLSVFLWNGAAVIDALKVRTHAASKCNFFFLEAPASIKF